MILLTKVISSEKAFLERKQYKNYFFCLLTLFLYKLDGYLSLLIKVNNASHFKLNIFVHLKPLLNKLAIISVLFPRLYISIINSRGCLSMHFQPIIQFEQFWDFLCLNELHCNSRWTNIIITIKSHKFMWVRNTFL